MYYVVSLKSTYM